ncbi:CvpA family protein [Sphingomonas sp. ID0503]|uniref:CvpA family protein n=1 Tax=Sphingomonas sp. ID0503 TaxID=3399691 RepID=UPI003AFAC5ED
MTALDIIVILLVGGLGVFGALRGFTSEVLSILTWIAIIFALKLGHAPVSALLAGPIGSAGGASVAAFALIGGVVWILGKVAASSIGGTAKRSVLGPVDRFLGFGFGAVKGLIVASLGYLLFNLAYDTVYGAQADRPEWLATSRTYPLLRASSRAIVDFVEARRRSGERKASSGEVGA